MAQYPITAFPSHSVDPEIKKSKDWCKQFAMAINGLYYNNMTGICINDVANYQRLRAYGNGRQSVDQYKTRLVGGKKTGPTIPRQTVSDGNQLNPGGSDYARKGYMNINWDILAIAPKFKNVVLGTFENLDHNVYADGIDEKSSAEKCQAKWELWVEMQFKEFFNGIEQQTGVKTQKPDYIPESLQELEMFAQMGGFKLKSEISIEEGLRYTLSISEWQEIKRKLYEDAYEIGVLGVRDYVDPFTQKVKTRYCDPEFCVIPWTRQTDYKNMPFAGEYLWYTIAELRATNDIATGKPAFTELELQQLAQGVQNQYGNYTIDNWSINAYGGYLYDGFRIPVLDCEFKSDDYKYVTKKLDEKGEVTAAYDDEFGRDRNATGSSKKRKTEKIKTLMVYKCKWVVGTDIVWDYGHQFDIPRPTPSEADLSFHFYKIKGRSMVDMMTAALDSFQLSWLKLQNAKAMAKPKGISIEISSLTNVTMGNQKMQPLDLLKIYNESGHLLYSATTQRSYNPTGIGNSKPIQELEGGLGAQGLEFLQQMNNDLNLIRDITGINRIADASSPTSEDLVGTTEIAMQATSTALKPLLSGYLTVKERTCKSIALRLQLLVKFNKAYRLGYYSVFGKPVTTVLEIGSEINNAMFGIRIEARPDAQEKKTILDAGLAALQVGRDGKPVISYSDWMMINYFVEQGMLKFARAYLAAKEQQAAKESMAEKQQLIEQQNQGNVQLKQAETEGALTVLQTTSQLKNAEIQAQNEADMRLKQLEHTNKMEEIRLTESMKGQVKLQTSIIDHSTTIAEQDNQHANTLEEIKNTPKPTVAKK